MGTRGPIPKTENELSRPRERRGGDEQSVLHGERRPVTWDIGPDPDWDPIATRVYESVKTSGQVDFYQDSDWAYLYFVCDNISYYTKPSMAHAVDKRTGEIREYEKPRSGQMLASIISSMGNLMLTEGDRRRVRMELQAPPEPKADLKVVAMDAYKGLAD